MDDLVPLANTPVEAESLLNGLDQAAGSIDLHFKQGGATTWTLTKHVEKS